MNWREGYDYPSDEDETQDESEERGCDIYHQQKDDEL
jgi:hypothetical protein